MYSGGSRNFAKETRALKMRSLVAVCREVDTNKLRAIIRNNPLKIMQEVSEELHIDHSMVIWHLKQIGMVKKLNEWVSHVVQSLFMSWLQIKEIVLLQCPCLLYATTMNYFSIGLWYVMTSGFYTTARDDQLGGWSKKFQSTSQIKLAPKKVMVVVWCLLPISTTAFWIPAKPLHLRSMFNTLMRCTENCNTYSQYWSTEWAQFFSTTITDCALHNKCFKSWTNWATEVCLIYHLHLTSCPWLLTSTSSNFSTTFCTEMLPQPARGRKCFPRVCQILKHRFLHYRNKPTYFLIDKIVLTVMVPILIKKNMFEPRYNDLKFMVWN